MNDAGVSHRDLDHDFVSERLDRQAIQDVAIAQSLVTNLAAQREAAPDWEKMRALKGARVMSVLNRMSGR